MIHDEQESLIRKIDNWERRKVQSSGGDNIADPQLHDSYVNGYPDRAAMGFIQPHRIQVWLLKPDLALALTWWTINFPHSHQKVVGNTTMNLQKFDGGWKIVASHSSTNQM